MSFGSMFRFVIADRSKGGAVNLNLRRAEIGPSPTGLGAQAVAAIVDEFNVLMGMWPPPYRQVQDVPDHRHGLVSNTKV